MVTISSKRVAQAGLWYACARGRLEIVWRHIEANEGNTSSLFSSFLRWNFVKVCIVHDIDAYFTIWFFEKKLSKDFFFCLEQFLLRLFYSFPLYLFYTFFLHILSHFSVRHIFIVFNLFQHIYANLEKFRKLTHLKMTSERSKRLDLLALVFISKLISKKLRI